MPTRQTPNRTSRAAHQRPHARHALALACASAIALTAAATSATAQAQPSTLSAGTALNLPAQPLQATLNALSRNYGVAIGGDASLLAGKTAPAIQGQHSLQQALDHALASHNLRAVRSGAAWTVVAATASSGDPSVLPEVVVTAPLLSDGTTEGTGSYTQTGPSGAATGLGLTLRETPQSLTVMTSQRMEDFKLETLTDVLEQTPGITVERQGSRVGFQARGTSVNLQTEGNAHSSAGYAYFGSGHFTLDNMVDVDRIEVLKGSNGLLVGKGNAGATINMIRKRPSRELQARLGTSVGSWSNYSINADVGGPINEADTVRGRVAVAASDGKGFREHEKNKSQTVYGTVEVDLTPNTVLAAGLTYRKRHVRGLSLWRNIVAYDVNAPSEFLGWKPRSYNPGVSWSGYKQDSTNVFARLDHQFGNDWTGKVQLAHENVEMPEMLLAGAGENFETATRYLDTQNRNSGIIADLKGPLRLFGRTHDVLLGAGASNGSSDFDSNNFGASHHEWKQSYAYAASRINLADPLKVIVGARITNYENQNGSMYDNSGLKETGVVTPYAGLVFDVSKHISLYGSYASIFQPQSSQDEQGRTLAPREGLSYEIGAKGEFFDKRLNASISHFWLRTDNEPEATGGRTPSGGTAYRAVMGASRRGYELELSGEVARGWQVQGGYTMNSSNLSNSGSNPKQQFKLGSTHRFAGGSLQDLTVGAAARWQSKTVAFASDGWYGSNVVAQPSYWVMDLMARYQINDQLSISVNINNALDKKYFAYVEDGVGGLGYTWGAPRSVNVSVRYDF